MVEAAWRRWGRADLVEGVLVVQKEGDQRISVLQDHPIEGRVFRGDAIELWDSFLGLGLLVRWGL